MIDDTPFWGSDGQIPHEQVLAMRVVLKDRSIPLQVAGMMNSGLSQDNLDQRFQLSPVYPGLYQLTGKFSDGAGAYIAQWYITRKGAIRTFIGQREALFELAHPGQ